MIHTDKNGYPIHKGDLLRTPHYVGRRRKMHYLYHVVVEENGILFMVPASHLEPTFIKGGGRVPMTIYSDTWASEIIHGYGPEPILSFEDRPRIKFAKSKAKEAAHA